MMIWFNTIGTEITDIDESGGELMTRRGDIDHDFTTIAAYPEHVAVECTCGYHAPPVGLAENPDAHIESCAYRTSRLRGVNGLGKLPAVNAAGLACCCWDE